MELDYIDTILIEHLVTKPQCISWSADDKIALITDDCIYVFELYPIPASDQSSLTLIRSVIPISSVLPLTDVVINNKINSFLWKLNNSEIYDFTSDSTISCNVKKSCSSHVVHSLFSPKINGQCYISCLTNNGSLDIYKCEFEKWTPVINVTELWIKHCQMECSANVDFEQYRFKMYKLKILSMLWSESADKLFVTGHEDGGICFWDVNWNDGLSLTVRHYFDVGDKPTTLALTSLPERGDSLLLVGLLSGQLKCIRFKFDANFTVNESWLWQEEDLIRPSSFKIKHSNDGLHVLTSKQHLILIQWLKVDRNGIINVAKTDWCEFSSAIVQVNQFQDEFIIVLQNHEMIILKESRKSGFSVSQSNAILRPGLKNDFNCYGIASSRNEAIWIAVSSPKVVYDNKTVKDVVHLNVFTTRLKMFKSLRDSTSTNLIRQIQREYKDTKLRDIYDLLELKRIESLTEPSGVGDVTDSVQPESSPLDLRLLLWEVKMKIAASQAPELNSQVVKLEKRLAMITAKRKLQEKEYDSELSPIYTQSRKMMKNFLEKSEKSERIVEENACVICNETAYMEDVRTSTCINLHKFPRCCLSLLPCTQVPYAFCRICDSVALSQFKKEESCPYCDGLLIMDSRLR